MQKIVTILLLLCCLTALAAQVPTSVRNESLAGIIDGEWEDIYDPIGLSFYNQTYYFTNLADLTQRIYVYDDSLSMLQESEFLTEYPFGFSFKSPLFKQTRHSFLIRFKDNQAPNLGTNTGETTDYTTTYGDYNDDGIFDYRRNAITTRKDYDDISSRVLLLLNTSMPLGNNHLGFRIAYDENKTINDNSISHLIAPIGGGLFSNVYSGTSAVSTQYTEYLLPDELIQFSMKQTGDFETVTQDTKLAFMLSFMKQNNFLIKDSELRYDLNIDHWDSNNVKTTDQNSGDYYELIDEIDYNHGVFCQSYNREYSSPKTEVFLTARLRRNHSTGLPRYLQGFAELALGLGGISGDITRNYTSTEDYRTDNSYPEHPENTFSYTSNSLENNVEEGTLSGIKALVSVKANCNLSEYICFAYGAKMNWQTIHSKVDQDLHNVSTIKDIEGIAFDAASDEIITNTYSYSGKYESVENTLTTTLPVALEFRLPKEALSENDAFSLRNFSFRLGTIFTHKDYFNDRRYEDVGLEVQNFTVVNGLGELTAESHTTNNSLVNSKQVNEERSSNKTYTAGLGYQHSDYLNIDLGGWVNTNGDDFYIGAMFTLKR